MTQADKNSLLVFANIPGLNVAILNSLKSPNVDEYSIGFSTRLGNSGNLRLDYVNRNYKDFYIQGTLYNADGTPQTVNDSFGNSYDMSQITNTSSILTRKYNGIHVSASYRLSDSINLGGNYTWSTLKGNFNGENGGSGPVPGNTILYPEYKAFAQYNPSGYLAADQRHRLRVYGVWDILNTKHNRLSFSVMESYLSAPDISAVGNICNQRPLNYVTNPGYSSPPSTVSATTSARAARTAWTPRPPRTSRSPTRSCSRCSAATSSSTWSRASPTSSTSTPSTTRRASRRRSTPPLTPATVWRRSTRSPPSRSRARRATPPRSARRWAPTTSSSTDFGQPLTPTTSTTQGAYQLPRTIILSLGVRF